MRRLDSLKVDFNTLVLSFSSATYIALGIEPSDEKGSLKVNKQLAQLNIYFLDLLYEKTLGNLTEEEENLMLNVLSDLRLKFTECKDDA